MKEGEAPLTARSSDKRLSVSARLARQVPLKDNLKAGIAALVALWVCRENHPRLRLRYFPAKTRLFRLLSCPRTRDLAREAETKTQISGQGRYAMIARKI